MLCLVIPFANKLAYIYLSQILRSSSSPPGYKLAATVTLVFESVGQLVNILFKPQKNFLSYRLKLSISNISKLVFSCIPSRWMVWVVFPCPAKSPSDHRRVLPGLDLHTKGKIPTVFLGRETSWNFWPICGKVAGVVWRRKKFHRQVPKDSLSTQVISCGTIFQTTPRLFHSFLDFGIHIRVEDAAKGLPEENLERGFRLSLRTVWIFKAQTFPQ